MENEQTLRVPSYIHFTPASPAASVSKRANTSEGGHAEKLLRSVLWRRGLRFRKHAPSVIGKPDLVFVSARLCVFCDGDFWHGRNWPVLKRRLQGRANPDYWIPKIERNIQRDREQTLSLELAGWSVFRVWESDVLKNPDEVADQICSIANRSR